MPLRGAGDTIMQTTPPAPLRCVPVETTPITITTFGFLSPVERDAARAALARRFDRASGVTFTFTPYRDTTSDCAAQIIFWLAGQRGGFRLNTLGQFVSCVSGDVVAVLR
jgi:hypothetical protein